MGFQIRIEQALNEEFQPTVLQVENESHRHSGPGSETHFKVALVTARFEGMSRVVRHQAVYRSLNDLLQAGLHALALHLYTEKEWAARLAEVPASPNCMGGSKTEPVATVATTAG